MRSRSTAEWQARLDDADVPNGPVHGLADLLEDDYLAETDFFRRVEHPSEGRMLVTAVPVDFSESPGLVRLLPPRLGEHTGEVLREAGLSEAEICDLIGRRNTGGP